MAKERLGHADIAMSMRYSHVWMSVQRDAAARLDAPLADGRGDDNNASSSSRSPAFAT